MEANGDEETIVILIEETNRIVGNEDIDSIVLVEINYNVVNRKWTHESLVQEARSEPH